MMDEDILENAPKGAAFYALYTGDYLKVDKVGDWFIYNKEFKEWDGVIFQGIPMRALSDIRKILALQEQVIEANAEVSLMKMKATYL